MLLVLDIGNTNITLGVYDSEKLLFVSRLATDRSRTEDQFATDLYNIFNLYQSDMNKVSGAIIGSVVPEITVAVRNAVKKLIGKAPLIIGPGIKTGLNIRVDDPAHLGADLVCGAVAAINLYELPCLIIDLGTASKISVLDENGTFRGCTISPGVEISINALSKRTSQLPHISLEAAKNIIGTNSIDSMRAGIVYGTADMLDGLCDRIEKELGTKVKTIAATGGLAEDIIRHSKKDVILNKNLLLEGLRIIYNKNVH